MLITRTAGEFSNSYATIADVNDYLLREGITATAWNALSANRKESVLILAAQVIDSMRLRGRKLCRRIDPIYIEGVLYTEGYPEQAMAFPRDIQEDRKHIPTEVVECQIELAVINIAPMYSHAADGSVSPEELGVSSVTIGPLSVEFKNSGKRPEPIFKISDVAMPVSSIVYLKMRKWLTDFRGGVVDTKDDFETSALEDYVVITTTSTTSTSSTTTSSSSSSTTT